MYGLVNRGVEELVCSNFGDETWQQIKEKAQIEDELFISMEQYDDNVTYALVEAASEVLELPPETILETFGRYWILYTGKEGYGHLLNTAGNTFEGFLGHLDQMHTRVSLIYPNLQPPSFRCTNITAQGLHLHYYSHRAGLAHLVIGLLQGLGELFETAVEVTHIQRCVDGADHDIFQLCYP